MLTMSIGMFKPTKFLFLKHRKHGMLVEENQGFISAIMDSIEAECRKLQFDLNIIISDNQFVETIHSIDFSSYIGMIVLATELDWNLYKTLLDIPIPFVVVDNNVPVSLAVRFPLITGEMYTAL